MTGPTVRVAAVQTVPDFGAVEENRNRIVEAVRAADIDLVVLPELATTGHALADRRPGLYDMG